jgi:hypothetical protein
MNKQDEMSLADLVAEAFGSRKDRAEKVMKFFEEQDATTPGEARADGPSAERERWV